MSSEAAFWLGVTLLCIAVQSFYSMLEMACVSFNRVRLQYYVDQGHIRAQWLNHLLENPARLFGTTLIGVNVALQIGSECSRQFYTAMNLSPDIAPLTQVALVLIFAELSPMFAARRYAEHVSLLGIPVIYASAKLLRPVTWSFMWISKLANRVLGSAQSEDNIFITRDELQKVFEDSEEEAPAPVPGKDFNTVVANIFSLRSKTAGQTMEPLSTVPMLPSNASVAQMRGVLKTAERHPFVAIYHRTRRNVVGIAFPRDLLKTPDTDAIIDHARSPWFLTRTTRIFRVLKQFRQNNQSVAVVLSDKGSAIGILTLDGILSEIFGKADTLIEADGMDLSTPRHIERTFSSDLAIAEFNEAYNADLPLDAGPTLLDLMTTHLGHEPTKGEVVRMEAYELETVDSPLLGEKKITIRTRPI